jgi:hypothetical protein
MGCFFDSNLMIALRRVHCDNVFTTIKINEHSGVAPRDGVNNDACNGVQGDVVHAEPPNKFINAALHPRKSLDAP